MSYNRKKAVDYALKHALSPNPSFLYLSSHISSGGNCTNFISQCLLAGGAEMSYSTNPWWYRQSSEGHSWSVTWTVAHSLYWHIKNNTHKNLKGIKAEIVGLPTELSLGDIIFYENFQGKIHHSAIVTDYKNGLPLISQNTYDLKNVSYIKDYPVKAMHFMHIYL